jgi:spore coat protein A
MQRRDFLKLGAAASAAFAAPWAWSMRRGGDEAAAATQFLGSNYSKKFTQPLRLPARIDLTAGGTATIDMLLFRQAVLSGFSTTRLWGYAKKGSAPGWPGPTIVAKRDVPVTVQFRNRLPIGTGDLATSHLLPLDTSLHMAEPIASLANGAIPTVPHLHGGHTEWQSDGHPEAWFTQGGAQRGPLFQKSTYTFDNSQGAGTLWYHDHTLGLTRLNVYAGLAGAYLLRDDNELGLIASGVLPDKAFEMELVVQDRFFSTGGQLFLPTVNPPKNGAARSIFGDFMMVNGTPWPLLQVEPRKYRFRLVNGSDSRMLVLQLDNPNATFTAVGTELGLRQQAANVNRLLVGPGERYDLVIDFTNFAGTDITLRNFGVDGPLTGFRNSAGTTTNDPDDIAFGQGSAVKSGTTGQIMKFRVNLPLSPVPDATVTDGTVLGGPANTFVPTATRQVITYNGRDSFGRFYEMLGTLAGGTLQWMDPPTETPALGTTEVWEIYNTGPVAHPVHLHLVDFRVLDRQRFTFTATSKPMVDHNGLPAKGATLSNVKKRGTPRPPEAYEAGPKDTVVCYPNEVTRVVATFDRPGNYVWHCHILHHEDHDMMRPLVVS